MSWIDYLLVALIAAAVVFTARYLIRKRKSGGCFGCDCASCTGCMGCGRENKR